MKNLHIIEGREEVIVLSRCGFRRRVVGSPLWAVLYFHYSPFRAVTFCTITLLDFLVPDDVQCTE